MKRKVYSLLLMAVLVCSLLTACGGSGGSVSGPNGSYPTGNNEISTRFDQMYTDYYRTGSGDRVFTSSGWHWDYTYYYKLHINITIKNTGNTVAYIDDSNFMAYWIKTSCHATAASAASNFLPVSKHPLTSYTT